MYEVSAIENIASKIVAENNSCEISFTVITRINENSLICAKDIAEVKEFLLS